VRQPDSRVTGQTQGRLVDHLDIGRDLLAARQVARA
jgi:hypothetical protein